METKLTLPLEKLRAEILTLTTFEEKLMKWAEFTVDYCDKVARKIDRAFYAFQSEPKFEPDVLFLGLNPHGAYPYTSQRGNTKWGLKDGMTPEVFIQQNAWYIGGRHEDKGRNWRFILNLKKIFNVHPDFSLQLDNMVYMNILYFNSVDFKEFETSFQDDWEKVFNNCVELSRLAIFDIIKPKRIVCLGKSNCFNSFVGKSATKENIGPIIKAKLYSTDIYGITHPSARISDVERINIGMHLHAAWSNETVSDFMAAKLNKIEKIFSEIAAKHKLELKFDSTNLEQRFGKFNFYNSEKTNVSIRFEFQRAFYSDLRFELHNERFINKAKKCEKSFDNWLTLKDDFDSEAFKDYFEREISMLSDSLNSLT